MTLVLSLANSDYCVQLSDRRLTGGLSSETAPKAMVVQAPDARAVAGFSGLARAGTFDTQQWLLERLADSKVTTLVTALESLCADLTARFRRLAVDPQSKRLSIMLAGYRYEPDPPGRITSFPLTALLSNFEALGAPARPVAGPTFDLKVFPPTVPDPVWIKAIGQAQALDPIEVGALSRMLAAHVPATAVAERATRAMLAAANRSTAAATVGSRLSVVILPVHPQHPVSARYVTDAIEFVHYAPDYVCIDPQESFAVWQPAIASDPAMPGAVPISVPAVGRRRPCACGSNKRYKNCHGRL